MHKGVIDSQIVVKTSVSLVIVKCTVVGCTGRGKIVGILGCIECGEVWICCSEATEFLGDFC